VTIVRHRQATCIVSWIEAALHCGVAAHAGFARQLQSDFAAVHNALLLPWSNGQVEGQINRLKFIKSQMYGRTKFDLLRKTVVGLASCASPLHVNCGRTLFVSQGCALPTTLLKELAAGVSTGCLNVIWLDR
jgi:hypothetical protein